MFTISLNGKKTIYEQIRDQIINFIALGVMKPHEKIPSVRSLALDLGINPNTVFKAYQELEREGYIYMMPKKGAFVVPCKSTPANGSLFQINQPVQLVLSLLFGLQQLRQILLTVKVITLRYQSLG